MSILDRVRDRLARRATAPSAEPEPQPQPQATPTQAAWRTAAPTPSVIPKSATAADTEGLHRNLTVKRQHVTLQPLGHDVTPTVGGHAKGLIAVPSPISPPRSGVISRSLAGAKPAIPAPGETVHRHVDPTDPSDADLAGTALSDGEPRTTELDETGPGAAAGPLERRAAPAADSPPRLAPISAPANGPIDRSPESSRSDIAATPPAVLRPLPAYREPMPARPSTSTHDTAPAEAGIDRHVDGAPAMADVPDTSSPSMTEPDLSPEPTADLSPVRPAVNESTPAVGSDPALAVPLQRHAETRGPSSPTVGLRRPLPTRAPQATGDREQPAIDRRPAAAPAQRQNRANPAPAATPTSAEPTSVSHRQAPAVFPADGVTHVSRTEHFMPEDEMAIAGDDPEVASVRSSAAAADLSEEFNPVAHSPSAEQPAPVSLQPTTSPQRPPLQRNVESSIHEKRVIDKTTPAAAADQPRVARSATPNPPTGGRRVTSDPTAEPTTAPRPGLGPALDRQERPGLGQPLAAEPHFFAAPVSRSFDPTRTPPGAGPAAARHSQRATIPSFAPPDSASVDTAPPAADPPAQDGLELLLQRVAEPETVSVDAHPVSPQVDTPAIQIDRASTADPSVSGSDPVDAGALAEQLYAHIERRLRNDLLHEVERRGQLSRWG